MIHYIKIKTSLILNAKICEEDKSDFSLLHEKKLIKKLLTQ